MLTASRTCQCLNIPAHTPDTALSIFGGWCLRGTAELGAGCGNAWPLMAGGGLPRGALQVAKRLTTSATGTPHLSLAADVFGSAGESN